MAFQLSRAEKRKLKLRIALAAPSGGGKTYSALLLASGIAAWDKIAVIDTENGSANYYADLGDYFVLGLNAPYTPERYIEAIQACENAGVEVIILDSMSHEWNGKGGILEIKDAMTGNDYAKWAPLGKRHTAFMEAILHSKCHVVCTMRSKQDYQQVQNAQGKLEVQKLGMAPVQRDGMEYEFGVTFDIDIKHNATSSKDRTGLFDGQPPFRITADTGRDLLAWANTGADVEVFDKNLAIGLGKLMTDTLKEAGADEDTLKNMRNSFGQALNARDMEGMRKLVADAEKLAGLSNGNQEAA